nr:recombinase family protein [Clostridium beijerinckii]
MAENKRFDILICYRLDRISRNVADFSTTLQTIQQCTLPMAIRTQFHVQQIIIMHVQ